VYHAQLQGVHVACKEFPAITEQKDKDALMAVISKIYGQPCDQLVTIIGASYNKPVTIVSEVVLGSNLHAALFDEQAEFTEPQALSIALDVARGLAYLHKAGINHGALTSANVLVFGDFHAKLSDYGLSLMLEASSSASQTTGSKAGGMSSSQIKVGDKTQVVTTAFKRACFQSPERQNGAVPSSQDDIFSFGMILYELGARRTPFEGSSSEEIRRLIKEGKTPRIPDELKTHPLSAILQDCWQMNPAARPSAAELVSVLGILATVAAPKDGDGKREEASKSVVQWLEQRKKAAAAAPPMSKQAALKPQVSEDVGSRGDKPSAKALQREAAAKAKKS